MACSPAFLQHPRPLPAVPCLKEPFQVDDKWLITRAGSARFGSGLPNSDEPGR